MKKMKTVKTKAKVIFFALSMVFASGSIAVPGSLMSAYAKETVDTQDNQTDCIPNESVETKEMDESQSNSESDDYGVVPCVDVGRDRGDV